MSDAVDEFSRQKGLITQESKEAWKRCDFSLSEPKLIKSFTLDQGKGVDYLNKKLAKTINSSQGRFVIKFAGVYLHQRPYVQRSIKNSTLRSGSNKTETCELSDLMFLSVLVDQKKTVITSRACFFQAKKNNVIDNKTQQWLYDFDDGFAYTSSTFWEKTACAKPERKIPLWDDERSTAFQYLILEASEPRVRLSPWCVQHSHEFSFYFYRLLTMASGKFYSDGDKTLGGWSSIVNDILSMGVGKMANMNRGSHDLDKVVDYFNDFREHDKYFYDSGEVEGFPLVLAIIQDTKNTLDS